jgi:predicted ATP-grasp superfamily ATP-dependent carboligase
MSELFNLWEKPESEEIVMLAGWRQWADGGSTSSGLPRYLAGHSKARKIGEIPPDGFYIFQIPGAQQFLRPHVRHNNGLTETLNTQKNEFYYTENGKKGVVIFIGDEPHMDAERYTKAYLGAAKALNVSRIVQFGGVYAQIPYDRARHIHAIYSLPTLADKIKDLEIDFSNYQGPASIGSYVAKRAGEQRIELIGLYAFNPIYQFGTLEELHKTIHVENDYLAWLNVVERVNHMLGLNFDLGDLEEMSDNLVADLDQKVRDLDTKYPELRIEAFMQRLRSEFEEKIFNPLDDIWENELNRLGDQFFGTDDDQQD